MSAVHGQSTVRINIISHLSEWRVLNKVSLGGLEHAGGERVANLVSILEQVGAHQLIHVPVWQRCLATS